MNGVILSMQKMPENTDDLTEKIICPNCEKTGGIIKHGFRKTKYMQIQVYKCKKCGYFFDSANVKQTREERKQEKQQQKNLAHYFFVNGISMNRISKKLGVSIATVSRWLNPLSEDEISQHAVNASKMTEENEKKILMERTQLAPDFWESIAGKKDI